MKAYWYNFTNMGDMLSPITIKGVTGVTPEWDPNPSKHRVVGLGSIMGSVKPGDFVWGTGCISETAPFDVTGADILAVRGPLTAAKLKVDVPFGDPALLMPRFYIPSQFGEKHEVGIVPHYVDIKSVKPVDGVPIIDVRMNWMKTIDYITNCETIVSSCLHGIIIAEAYGIPAVWVKVTDKVLGNGFKFDDYYLSTGRKPVEPASLDDLEDAVKRVQPPPVWDSAPLLEVAKRLPRV